MTDYNLHQHSIFSDGKEPLESYVDKAIELGMTAIGFTEHSPLPFDNSFSLKAENIAEYIRQTDLLKEKYKNELSIYRALEMDYIPGMSEDFNYWRKKCKADYLIGSIHLIKPEGFEKLWFTDGPDYKIYDQGIQDFFGGDIKKAVRRFYWQTNKMIETQQFEIIGHFDKIKMHNRNRFFTEDEKWYQNLINETVHLIKEKDLIVEVNTRGIYKKRSDALFPDGYALQKVKELNIPIILSSDAHQPSEQINLFDETIKKLIDMGFKKVYHFNNDSWQSRALI